MRTGRGSDLDLVLIPLANRTKRPDLLAMEFGGTVRRRSLNQERGIRSYEVEKDGRLYHWIFGRFYATEGE